jgi:hypothetical protein
MEMHCLLERKYRQERIMGMHAPVCIPCGKQYLADKNGVTCRRGKFDIIFADRWKCPGCGHEIITGWSGGGEWMFQPDYEGEIDYQLDDY